MARSFHSHRRVGVSTSVLKEDFVSSYPHGMAWHGMVHGDSLVGAEPFSGRIVLPTKLQALKLHFFLKDEAGRKNSTVTPGQITGKVAEVIKHWVLAGYETVTSPQNKIAKLWRTTSSSTKIETRSTRKVWSTEVNLKRISINCWTLLSAHPNLEKILS